ncbi:TonB-dependent receptor [Massilia suwonensis]|uniref:TonB-dependent receptor n=1 Tax=Massilia suwonensis TaxID=648895 RepID=A0ABW0MIF7_9BURK
MKQAFALKPSVIAVALTIAAGSSLVPASAFAQTQGTTTGTAEESQPVAKVYVTGSNIRRINAETASPVQVITRDEMVRGGATSLTEVLKGISANVGGISEDRTGGFSAGASSLNLRGIGSQATLMLINGRRLAPYAQPEFQTTFVDLNSIPVGAVERIEVLKDGASAIYGSEAIAGVVNIIMRDSFEGVEIGGSVGKSSRGDGQQVRSTLSAGFGSLVDNHWNAYATLDVRQRKPMFLSNRDDYIGTQDWREWGYRDARTLYTYPGNIYWTDKATGKFVARTLDGNCPADRLVPASTQFGAGTQGNVCVFDDLADGDVNSGGKTDRIGITSRATWQINANTTAFAEVIAHQNKARVTGLYHWVAGQNGQPTGALPITSPQYPKDLIGPDGKTLAGGNGTVRVRASLKDLPGQGQDNKTDFGRYLAGVKGSIGNWDWESAAFASTSKVESHNTSGLLLTPFTQAYNSGKFIFGNAAGNADLLKSIMTDSVDGFKSSLYQIDGKISGELFTLPAGAVGIAAGVEARREKLTTSPDPLSVEGELYHHAQSPPGYTNSRTIKSVYAEMTAPILKSLEAQLAVRHDRYSDYGTSTTPKLGLKWSISPQVVVRGTYAEGFRAPTLVENSSDVRHAFLNGFRDPARCNATFKEGCNSSSAYDSGANPALAPETAKSYTMGLAIEPTSWLVATLDFWRIRRDNEIGTYDLTRVLEDPARYANDPAAVIVRDPLTDADKALGATAGEISLVKLLLTNVAVTDVRGVDLDLRGKFNFGEYGRLEPRLQLAYQHSYKYAPSLEDEQIQYVGTRGTPRLQGTFGLAWKKAAWQLSADAVFVGHMAPVGDYTVDCVYETEGFPALCENKIPSFTVFNLGGSYKGAFGVKDLKLGFAIQNAFDRKPPFNPYSGLGFYQPLHNPMGRYFQVSADYSFK